MELAATPSTLPLTSRDSRLSRYLLVRLLLATLAICLPVAMVLISSSQIADKALRAHWPPLLAALLGVCAYRLYVRKVERRTADEMGSAGLARELGAGLCIGTGLVLMVLAVIALGSGYQWHGISSADAVPKVLTEMIFVALIEELLFRVVLLRMPEQALGSWAALALSSCIFALAHLPNDNVSVLAIVNTLIAGVLFGAAWLCTRRLWLPAAMHFAWNFVSCGVFSVPNSGNPGRGLLQLHAVGPEWLTGGGYGPEGSLVTLVVMGLASVLLLRRAVRAHHIAPPRGGKKLAP